jgi:allatostatin receptor
MTRHESTLTVLIVIFGALCVGSSDAFAEPIDIAKVDPLVGTVIHELDAADEPQDDALLPSTVAVVDNGSVDLAWIEQLVTRVVPVLFGCIFITGLIGNMLVVIVVVRNAAMRNTTNLLILNLALADLLFILFCVPFTACDYALAYWPFGDTWCRVVQYLILVLACASIYTLVLMSLDRFLAVVHPVRSIRLRSSRNAAYALLTMWFTILSLGAPALITHGVLSYEYGTAGSLYLACRYNGNWLISYSTFQVSFFILSYVAPLCVALVLYICMLHRLWTGNRQACSSRRRRKKVTRMVTRFSSSPKPLSCGSTRSDASTLLSFIQVVVVLLIFAVSWAPIQLMLVCRSLQMCNIRSTHAIMLQIAAQVLAYMNSCVNPILYAFLSENFRRAFRRVILCEVENRNVGTGNPTQQGGNNQAAVSIAPPMTATSPIHSKPNHLLVTGAETFDCSEPMFGSDHNANAISVLMSAIEPTDRVDSDEHSEDAMARGDSPIEMHTVSVDGHTSRCTSAIQVYRL